MSNQHRATPEQWERIEHLAKAQTESGILELRARIEALEAQQHAHAKPAWRPVEVETTYGSKPAADAEQILNSRMVVEAHGGGSAFGYGGETYRFNAPAERDASTTEARPGGLVERVAKALHDAPHLPGDWSPEARAAIREVAAAIRARKVPKVLASWDTFAQWLEQEADRG